MILHCVFENYLEVIAQKLSQEKKVICHDLTVMLILQHTYYIVSLC